MALDNYGPYKILGKCIRRVLLPQHSRRTLSNFGDVTFAINGALLTFRAGSTKTLLIKGVPKVEFAPRFKKNSTRSGHQAVENHIFFRSLQYFFYRLIKLIVSVCRSDPMARTSLIISVRAYTGHHKSAHFTLGFLGIT